MKRHVIIALKTLLDETLRTTTSEFVETTLLKIFLFHSCIICFLS